MVLEATGLLQPTVSIKQIIISFIDRLAVCNLLFLLIFQAFAKRERETNSSNTNDETNNEANETQDSKAEESGTNPEKEPEHETGIPSSIPLFEIFWKQVSNTIDQRPDIVLEDVSALLISLMNMAVSCYPDRIDYVYKIFQFANSYFQKANPSYV